MSTTITTDVPGETVHVPVTTEKHVDELKMAQSRKKVIICALGIFICYFYYGILQESITKGKYGSGEEEETFKYTLALVFIQCIINTAFAKVILTSGLVTEHDSTPFLLYAACSLSYLGAMLASNHALQHVAYPTQVLGKSAKPIPVMLLGILLARKRYPVVKFLCVLLIVIGVAMFMYKDSKADDKAESHTFGIGEILLLVSLTLDGVTGATQDKMRGEYKTGAYSMMFLVNVMSILWLSLALIGTGEGLLFLGFVQRHPSILLKMVTFGVASALGQMFIFITVTSYGPLTCSIVTTTRKFFTILASVIIFQNPMNNRQWLATALVFTGLGLDSAYGKEHKKSKETKKPVS